MKSLSHLVEFRSNSCVLGQYYSMSSSTNPSGVNQTDAIIASDKAFGFKRWSRNLSSQRHRELDRLNQIEQHRQFLELKKQNDLFVQMSVTVTETRDAPRQVDSGIAESSSNKRSSKVFSEVNCSDQTENCVITDTVEVGSSKLRAPKPNKINLCHEVEDVNCEKIRVESNVATITHKRRNAGKRILSRENQSNSKQTDLSAKRHMTTEQLERFVSACVPANKRVLCLIVRDKMSRLNKAKSYFYPTYYLFIQAIVDIDSNGYERTVSATSEEDLVNEDILRNASAEGSFSASSSISADMMFIGSSNNETQSRKFGNSYSDNEVCGDTETEDDYRNVEKGHQMASEINQGRQSPLVYPNTDVNVATDFYNTDSKSLQMRKELNQDDCNKLKRNSIGTLNADLSKLTGQQVETKVKLSNEDSYDDDEDSDKDDLNYGLNELTDEDYGNEAGENAKINKYEENLEEVILFDEDENPYTGTYGILLTGRRRKKAKTLSHAENNNNDRCTIASISYETNVLGFKGPRKMRVFLAKNPSGGIKNLPELFKKNSAAVTQLKNMTPSWNVESQSYVLNFHGRVTQASVKNFQLIECTADQPSSALEGQVRQQIPLFQTGDSKQKQQLPQLNLVNKSATQALQMTNKERSQTGRFASNLTSQSHHQPQQSHFTTKRPTESGESDEPRRPAFDDEKEGSADMRALNSTSMFLTDDNEASVSSVTCGYGGEIGGVHLDKNAPLMDNKNSTYNSSIVMQFGRISNHEFTCDVTHPLSILQAFAIALSSFDSKLACE